MPWQVLAMIVVFGLLVLAQHIASDRHLKKWAEKAGLHIASKKKVYSNSGPFSGNHWRGQFVYRISAVDAQGRTRTGWVRVGHWLVGVLASDAAVIWDEQ